MPLIKTASINDLIDISFLNLKANFRTIKGKNGWHQYLGSSKIGNIATSQGILLLDNFEQDFDKKHLAVEYLFGSQNFDNHNKEVDGGWTYVTNFVEVPSTEATCWALMALYKDHKNDKRVKRGIQWLFSNYKNDSKDIGWGTIKTDVPRIYTTVLVLRTLNIYGLTNTEEFEKGLNWLLKSQNTDHGWGDQFGTTSTIFHTSFVLILLMDIKSKNTINIENGTKWLIKNFTTTNHADWNNISGLQEHIEFDLINSNNKHQRITYHHSPLPYAVNALLKTGNINLPIVYDGISELMTNNNAGFWGHPHIQSTHTKPIWAIYDALLTFNTLRKCFYAWNNSEEVTIGELTGPDKEKFINDSFNTVIAKKNSSLVKFISICIFNFILIVCAVILTTNSELKDWVALLSFWQIVVILIYSSAVLVEVIGSKYIFSKENFKDGWDWLLIRINKRKLHHFKAETMKKIESQYRQKK